MEKSIKTSAFIFIILMCLNKTIFTLERKTKLAVEQNEYEKIKLEKLYSHSLKKVLSKNRNPMFYPDFFYDLSEFNYPINLEYPHDVSHSRVSFLKESNGNLVVGLRNGTILIYNELNCINKFYVKNVLIYLNVKDDKVITLSRNIWDPPALRTINIINLNTNQILFTLEKENITDGPVDFDQNKLSNIVYCDIDGGIRQYYKDYTYKKEQYTEERLPYLTKIREVPYKRYDSHKITEVEKEINELIKTQNLLIYSTQRIIINVFNIIKKEYINVLLANNGKHINSWILFGKTKIVCGSDCIKVWDLYKKVLLNEISSSEIRKMIFKKYPDHDTTNIEINVLFGLKDGTLAAGLNNGMILLINIQTNKCFKILYNVLSPVTSLIELSDGRIISGYENGIIQYWGTVYDYKEVSILEDKPFDDEEILNNKSLGEEILDNKPLEEIVAKRLNEEIIDNKPLAEEIVAKKLDEEIVDERPLDKKKSNCSCCVIQ